MEIHDQCPPSTSESEGVNLIVKIESVLLKLISPDFRLSDDTILQKLHDCISLLFSIADCHVALLERFLPWIGTVVKQWSVTHSKTCSFALKILSLICAIERDFCFLLQSSILDDVSFHVYNSGEDNFYLQAYLDVMNSVLSHSSGCLWMFKNEIWKKILNIAKKSRNIYTLRKARSVITNLIISSGIKNVSACQCVIDEVLLECYDKLKEDKKTEKTPLILQNIPYQKECFQETLTHLNSVIVLRETILKMLDKKFTHSNIDYIFKKYNLVEWTRDNISNTENPRVMVELSRLLSAVNIALLPRLENGNINYSDMCIIREQCLDHFKLLTQKKQYTLVLEVCLDYFQLWTKFNGEIVHDNKDAACDINYSIENSLFVIVAAPLFLYFRLSQPPKSEVFEAFAQRVFDVSCVQTKRVVYFYVNNLRSSLKQGELSIDVLALNSVNCIIRLVPVCKKEQAVMCLQTLVYIMKSFIPNTECYFNPSDGNSLLVNLEHFTIKQPELLTCVLEALNCYISNFEFNWSDSLETVTIMPLLQKLVSPLCSNLTPRMSADALKLMKVVLLGYLPSHLALLMDTLQGSTLYFLGRELFRLLHSVHWEVRDSAIEVLQAVCLLAKKSMTSLDITTLEEIISEKDMPIILISVFQNDSEAYVRASALNCLCFMVKIQSIWDKILVHQSLVDKLLFTILHDQEGVVRYKTILLIKEIYECRNLRREELEKMFDVVYHVSLTDLHWEVKCGAILFWDTVFEKRLAEIGMSNGCFPDVIFSGERKKIIKLTPNETSSRIQQVFKSLCNYGCLHALWKIILDDCDLEVTREAGKLVTKMIDLIKKFNVPINNEAVMNDYYPEDLKMEVDNDSLKRKMSGQGNIAFSDKNELNNLTSSSDTVIESIVSEGDLNLLCGLARSMNSKKEPPVMLKRTKLSLDEFYCSIVSYDIIGKQIEKTRWLYKTSESINSLLDDILAANQFGQEKNNVIDCY